MRRYGMASLISAALLMSPTLPPTGPLPAMKPSSEAPSAAPFQGPPRPETAEVPKPEPKPALKEGAPETTPDGANTPAETQKDSVASPPPPPIEKEDPEKLKACLADLRTLGVQFEEKPAVTEGEGCGIEHPVEVKAIADGVTVSAGADMRCDTARALARWMKDMVQPALNVAMPGRKIVGITHASTYVCRLRNGASTGKISEHAHGNAIDIADFKLDNGQSLTMKPRDEDSTLEGAFQRAATAAACLYFTTVLSPGSDAAHETHLHLDVLQRTNGYRYCR